MAYFCEVETRIRLDVLPPILRESLISYVADVFYLNAAGQPIVVLNAQKAAADLLDRRAGIYSDRPRNAVAGQILCGGLALTFQNYGPFCVSILDFVTAAFLDGRIDGVKCAKLPMRVSANPSPSPSRPRNSMRPFYSPLGSLPSPQRWTTTFAGPPLQRSCLSRMAHHR